MKLKHRYLEQARKNPQSISQISEQTTGGKSMVRYWDWAVGHFHKDQDSKSALAYLENGLSNFNDNRANNNKREMLIEKFKSYVS
jgi:hypothetical protein